MEAKRILIIGNYGAGNLGDDAIFAGIVEELRTVGYLGKINLMHGGNNSSAAIFAGHEKVPFAAVGIRSWFKTNRKSTISAIKNADMVILGGGGLFTDAESIRAVIIWYAQAARCIKNKKTIICYGQSLGPLNTFLSKLLTKKVFNKCEAIHFRDTHSADLLKSLFHKKSGKNQSHPKQLVEVGTDPAISWALKQKKKKKQNLMILNLRLWKGINSGQWKDTLDAAKLFAMQNKLQLKVLAMDISNSKEIQELRKTGLKVIIPKSAEEAFGYISSAKILLTMRLHAGIFALCAGTPFMALSYSSKVKNFFDNLKIQSGVRVLEKNKSKDEILENLNRLLKEKVSVDLEKPIVQNQVFLTQVLQNL